MAMGLGRKGKAERQGEEDVTVQTAASSSAVKMPSQEERNRLTHWAKFAQLQMQQQNKKSGSDRLTHGAKLSKLAATEKR